MWVVGSAFFLFVLMKNVTETLTSLLYFSAEALDNHLTAVQRDHEHISQIEERKIRDDAAREEAKRKEKTIQEEKLRQERIKIEEEVLSCISIAMCSFFYHLIWA